MSEKKYEVVYDKPQVRDGETVFPIRALKNGATFKKGDLGGWIQHEGNLSHEGGCWIEQGCSATGGSTVSDEACLINFSRISGNASAEGNALISGTTVRGNAHVGHGVKILDSDVSGYADISKAFDSGGAFNITGSSFGGHATIDADFKGIHNSNLGGFVTVSGEVSIVDADINGRGTIEGKAKIEGGDLSGNFGRITEDWNPGKEGSLKAKYSKPLLGAETSGARSRRE